MLSRAGGRGSLHWWSGSRGDGGQWCVRGSPALGLPGSPQCTQGPSEPDLPVLFQDMELAYRELLRSLGGESSGGTTPVGSFHTEAARWADCSLSPPVKDPPSSDSWDSHELGPCPEDSE